ncbi:hypothetical protein TOPH_03322 [Tolypocladium ophioglossoides CBS 100239]|uniref:Uncharacterized protein n=1 Tax=Tolypocladium ophioglossoides (strain CBS 100239) TaxID=1163406 RepID=A0A0L0NCW8_TOLOC|nr:hypothetical protein TOPH_03322 [Tolypocladium ophioglossoides CBS 100239]
MMAPVNLNYQVIWTPPSAASRVHARPAKRSLPSCPSPQRHFSESPKEGPVGKAGAVRSNSPAVPGISFDEPICIFSDPDLELDDIGGHDGAADGGPDASQSDDTLLSLKTLVESVMREQPSHKSSVARPDVLSDDSGTHKGDEDTCRPASSTGRACQEESMASTEPSISSPASLSHLSPAPSLTTPPTPCTLHDNDVSLGFDSTSCPIDPALTGCLGQADNITEAPGAYSLKQHPCALEGLGTELSGCGPDGTTDESSMCTIWARRRAGEECRPSDTEDGGKDTSEDGEWPGKESPWADEEAPDHVNGIGVRGDEGCCRLVSGNQKQRHDDCRTGENADAEQPPRKRRKVGRPTGSMLSPPVSTSTGVETDDAPGIAEFEEWALQNVLLKRIMVDGVATFQLQFDWNLCTAHVGSHAINAPIISSFPAWRFVLPRLLVNLPQRRPRTHPGLLPEPILHDSLARWLADPERSEWSRGDKLDLTFIACVCHDLGTRTRHNAPHRFKVEGADGQCPPPVIVRVSCG